jgi:hypothetical protein
MRKILTIACFVLLAYMVQAQKTVNSLPNTAYQQGESINFVMYYGFINGGTVNGKVTKEVLEGKEVFHASVTAKTTGLADVIFKVKDIYDSYLDQVTGLPFKSVRNIHEGSYKYYNEVLFDRTNNVVNSQRSGMHKVPENIHDIVSCLYYFRRLDFTKYKEGDIINIQTYFGDEIFPVNLRYRGKETIKTGIGKIPCLKFAPVTEVGRVFATEDDMLIWISDDANHVPIRIRLEMKVGSVKCDLTDYTGLKTSLRKL